MRESRYLNLICTTLGISVLETTCHLPCGEFFTVLTIPLLFIRFNNLLWHRNSFFKLWYKVVVTYWLRLTVQFISGILFYLKVVFKTLYVIEVIFLRLPKSLLALIMHMRNLIFVRFALANMFIWYCMYCCKCFETSVEMDLMF